MARTIIDWFNDLPDEVRILATKECDETAWVESANSLKAALSIGFVWKKSKQGQEYWENIYDNLAALNQPLTT